MYKSWFHKAGKSIPIIEKQKEAQNQDGTQWNFHCPPCIWQLCCTNQLSSLTHTHTKQVPKTSMTSKVVGMPVGHPVQFSSGTFYLVKSLNCYHVKPWFNLSTIPVNSWCLCLSFTKKNSLNWADPTGFWSPDSRSHLLFWHTKSYCSSVIDSGVFTGILSLWQKITTWPLLKFPKERSITDQSNKDQKQHWPTSKSDMC